MQAADIQGCEQGGRDGWRAPHIRSDWIQRNYLTHRVQVHLEVLSRCSEKAKLSAAKREV